MSVKSSKCVHNVQQQSGMKYFLILFWFFLFCDIAAQKQLKIKADSVLIYKFDNVSSDHVFSVIENGILSPLTTGCSKLNKKEINVFTKDLFDERSYRGVMSVCFYPHLGVVFYRAGKVVEHVNVCLECNRIFSSYSMNVDLQKIEYLGTTKYYVLNGMSEKIARSIMNLKDKHFE